MSLPVHLVPSLTGVSVGSVVTVDGDEGHHAVAVRRLRVGEEITVTDGLGTSATGAVTEIGKRSLEVTVATVTHHDEAMPRITVVQALPKGDHGELAVDLMTQVGVQVIVPWAAERSVVSWKGERAEKARGRWQAAAREATKQSRRSFVPDVTPLATTAEVITRIAEVRARGGVAITLHEEGSDRLTELHVRSVPEVLLIIGPEGSLTDDEVAAFLGTGAQPVRLGNEILRSSSAGAITAGALLARTDRWG